MRRVALGLLTVGALVALAMPAGSQSPTARAGDPDGPGRVEATFRSDGGARGAGTITLDNNTPFDRDGQTDGLIGNRFNPVGTHSINSVSFRVAGNYVAAGTQGSIVMSIWAPGTANAQILARQNVTNAPGIPFGGTGTITDVTVMAPLSAAVTGNSGSFIAGIRNTAYAACGGNTALNSTCDGVALTAGTADPGDGFNAVRLPFTSGAFVPTAVTVPFVGTAIPNRNAIIRATGDNLPVELMQFGIE